MGEIITEDDLHLLSPGDGFRWNEKEQVIGKMAIRDIPRDEIIYKHMIQ
jgi:sialic acid synthase